MPKLFTIAILICAITASGTNAQLRRAKRLITYEEVKKLYFIRSVLGQKVKTIDFDPAAYWASGGGPIDYVENLQCNFETSCCWSSIHTEGDITTLKWEWGFGDINRKRFESNFVPAQQSSLSELPSGNFLAAISDVRRRYDDQAVFKSCTLCAVSNITIQFKHWSTPNLRLKVCWQDAFYSGLDPAYQESAEVPKSQCRRVSAANSPGPSKIVLKVPADTIVEIMFVASNFVDLKGGMVVIDDVEIKAKICGGGGGSGFEHFLKPAGDEPEDYSDVEEFFGGSLSDSESDTAQDYEDFFGEDYDYGEDEVPEVSKEDYSDVEEFFEGSDSDTENAEEYEDFFGDEYEEYEEEEIPDVSPEYTDEESDFFYGDEDDPVYAEEKDIEEIEKGLGLVTSSEEVYEGESCQTAGACSFESQSLCFYDNSFLATSDFELFDGKRPNRVFGIRGAAEGDFYALSVVEAKKRAFLEASVSFKQARLVIFHAFEATKGVKLRGCCFYHRNRYECPFQTEKGVKADHRKWTRASFICPPTTKKITFICENEGKFRGACAIDNIQIYEVPSRDQSQIGLVCD